MRSPLNSLGYVAPRRGRKHSQRPRNGIHPGRRGTAKRTWTWLASRCTTSDGASLLARAREMHWRTRVGVYRSQRTHLCHAYRSIEAERRMMDQQHHLVVQQGGRIFALDVHGRIRRALSRSRRCVASSSSLPSPRITSVESSLIPSRELPAGAGAHLGSRACSALVLVAIALVCIRMGMPRSDCDIPKSALRRPGNPPRPCPALFPTPSSAESLRRTDGRAP